MAELSEMVMFRLILNDSETESSPGRCDVRIPQVLIDQGTHVASEGQASHSSTHKHANVGVSNNNRVWKWMIMDKTWMKVLEHG